MFSNLQEVGALRSPTSPGPPRARRSQRKELKYISHAGQATVSPTAHGEKQSIATAIHWRGYYMTSWSAAHVSMKSHDVCTRIISPAGNVVSRPLSSVRRWTKKQLQGLISCSIVCAANWTNSSIRVGNFYCRLHQPGLNSILGLKCGFKSSVQSLDWAQTWLRQPAFSNEFS